MHFYDFFDTLCTNKGVTIPEAYTAMKINKGTVSKWKTARDAKELVVPSSKIAIKMAKYFSLDASLFLREDGNFEFEQKETPTPVSESGQAHNIIKIAGRDGSFVERELTDEQVALMKNMLDQLKPIDDDRI